MSAVDAPTLEATRGVLHRVAVHVVARARQQATGRFSLRVTPGGFGTPEFGTDGRRVRVSGGLLLVESDAEGAAAITARAITGSTLRELAESGGVDLTSPLDVGRDTLPLRDPDERLAVDGAAVEEISASFSLFNTILDAVSAAAAADLPMTLPRLWPEHFDLAIEVQAHPDRRVNLGGSPGDGYCPEPYLYVGPWTSDRPGDPAFWNAPFGASVAVSDLGDDPARAGQHFLVEGLGRLA